MNIQPISELNSFNNISSCIQSLSTINRQYPDNYYINLPNNVYFEISYTDDGSKYQSLKMPVNIFVNSIVHEISALNERINLLTAETLSIRGNYVKKAGDTMTGGLSIELSNSSNPALHIKKGNLYIEDNPGSNTYVNIHNKVKIQNGSLTCDSEIHGCALTAKWC